MSKLGLEYLTYIGKSPADDSLYVDDVNNRVGIGTSSPERTLEISASGVPLGIDSTNSNAQKIEFENNGTTTTYIGSSDTYAFTVANSSVTQLMSIDYGGDVGIGGNAPNGYRLEVTQNEAASDLYFRMWNQDTDAGSDVWMVQRVNNNTGYCGTFYGDSDYASSGSIRYRHNGDYFSFYLADTSTSTREEYRMDGGDFHANGDIVAYSTTVSDERLKENITLVDNAVEKVNQLKGVTFKYKTDGRVSAGVIAQDVEKVLPEAVAEKEVPLKMDDGEKYKTVRYDALHALLIEAIKELSAEVKLLKEGK